MMSLSTNLSDWFKTTAVVLIIAAEIVFEKEALDWDVTREQDKGKGKESTG